MTEKRKRFSRRNNLAPKHTGPLTYDEAPKTLRVAVMGLVSDDSELTAHKIREIVCRELRKEPSDSNWSEGNVWEEARSLAMNCKWFEFFDMIEAFDEATKRIRRSSTFEDSINQFFEEDGIGWYLSGGELEVRGDEPLEVVLNECFDVLETSGLEVATNELSEAWTALSRRPSPNVSGSVFHAMAALEAVAREWAGDTKPTLGDIVKKKPDIFPRPLDECVSKLWGFASEQARHGKEGRNLAIEEAFLAVGVSATLCSYLSRKLAADVHGGTET